MFQRTGRQRGAALLVVITILVLGTSWFMLSTLNATLNRTTAKQNHNGKVLQEAKAALIGYVAREVLNFTENVPGILPCPESLGSVGGSTEGTKEPWCAPTYASAKTIGRFPWKTIGIDKLVDSAGEPLWYVVSSNWVRTTSSSAPQINNSSSGQLNLDGTGDIVALIIAPGAPLTVTPNSNQTSEGCVARTQSRNDKAHSANPSSAPNPDYRDYLECKNAALPIDPDFITSVADNATHSVFNDQVVAISASDILNAIQGPVAERIQRTVAPLLSEFADQWASASGGRFLPYAVPFDAPENNPPTCGAAPSAEGFLPTSLTSDPNCLSDWQYFNIAGSGITFMPPCTTVAGETATCEFNYYTLRAGGIAEVKKLGLTPPATVTATLTAEAPNAAASLRNVLKISDVAIPVCPAECALDPAFTLVPQTNGDANLSLYIRVTDTDLCNDTLLDTACALLPPGWTTTHTVKVSFRMLADATLEGTQLGSPVMQGVPTPISLLDPLGKYSSPSRSPDDPHYWFFRNQWFRHTYYAVAPEVSAEKTGGYITVSGFPSQNGSSSDKRFVLALMGPAVVGQSRPAGTVNGYLEGHNASTGDNVFAFHVFASPGNDRIAACPFYADQADPATIICN